MIRQVNCSEWRQRPLARKTILSSPQPSQPPKEFRMYFTHHYAQKQDGNQACNLSVLPTHSSRYCRERQLALFLFFYFSLNRNCYNLCIFRAKLYRIYTMAWAFYIFQICIMRKWKIFAYFYTSEAYNSCVMFFWPVWGGSGSGGYLVVAKKLWSPVIWGAKA